MLLGYNLLITQKTLPINAFFVTSKQWLQVMPVHLSQLLLSLTIYSFDFSSDSIVDISPVISDKLFYAWLHWIIKK